MAQVLSERRILGISIAAAAATVIAGVLHLLMVPNSIYREAGEGILFLVGGTLQVFWAVPVIKRWGRIWQIIGIGGTAVFVALWFATHTHSLFGDGTGGHMPSVPPISNATQGGIPQDNAGGEHFPRGPPHRGIASIPQIEFFQIAFVGLYATISVMISRSQKIPDVPTGK